MTKKKPLRTCLGCRTAKEKSELLRIVRTPDGEIAFDRTGRKNGRGAYICRNPECLKKAFKAKSLARALKTEIPGEIEARLLEEIVNAGEK
ncbi:MAG TPA: YlxR family protein [Lachnospiraceae bacterium]|nr:YlxR family protein [Lachnospiraceae bacterium]